ncbi:hypothetical protein ACWJXL_10815 [Clostridioides difficile]|nr:hypothetical protein [Clostridioides difficile]MCK3746238.1 hypothetical protein [Clostridioides difficile]MCP8396050.1 hypothetical protein [Clostridioides difficile]MCP8414778.1 hypothetical protein [Clostridioides difficile]MCP8494123.1 hypothetical protein [Clostridioides difficile]MCP8657558.1 hypothetical protein [Clostridioides difficile]
MVKKNINNNKYVYDSEANNKPIKKNKCENKKSIRRKNTSLRIENIGYRE